MRKPIFAETQNLRAGNPTKDDDWWIQQYQGKLTDEQINELKYIFYLKGFEVPNIYDVQKTLIENIELPADLASLFLGLIEYEDLKEKLVEKYLFKYPEVFIKVLQEPINNPIYSDIRNYAYTKSNSFTDEYLETVLDATDSEKVPKKLKDVFLDVLITIVQNRKNKSEKILKKLIEVLAKNTVFFDNVGKAYVTIEDANPDLLDYLIQKLLEHDTLERIIKVSPSNKNEASRLLKKMLSALSPIKLTNLLTNFNHQPDKQIFLINSIGNDPKFLKVLMLLSRSKNKEVSSLAKEKIKSLKA